MVEPHKHCPICGTPIPLDELVCSQDCQTVWNQKIAQHKKSRIALFAIIILFVIVWFVFMVMKGSFF